MILAKKLTRDLMKIVPDDRVFPEFLPENEPFPAVVYQRVGGLSEGTACSEGEAARFHIIVYHRQLMDGTSLARRIQAQLRDTDDYIAEQDAAPDFAYLYDLKAHIITLDYVLSEF